MSGQSTRTEIAPRLLKRLLLALNLFLVGLILYSLLTISGIKVVSTPVGAVPLVLSPPVLNQLVKANTSPLQQPLPTRLKIPKIGVDASLDYVGLTRGGAMGVPTVPANAAWFKLGPRPGEIGSAVIDGHFGIWKDGQSSVFDNLYKLHKGDSLTVEDAKATTITFVVTELRIYDQNQDATDVFTSSDGQAHLNLITCEGVWNKANQNFPSRLIVFTARQ